jgi:hypothetical protein
VCFLAAHWPWVSLHVTGSHQLEGYGVRLHYHRIPWQKHADVLVGAVSHCIVVNVDVVDVVGVVDVVDVVVAVVGVVDVVGVVAVAVVDVVDVVTDK